jgi:hypothetical protein
MDVRRPENSGLIRYLETVNERPGTPDVRTPDDTELREFRIYGTHPEVAERVWAQLGASVPMECRQVVLGRPALLILNCGIIFAIGIGTSYAIRVPRRVKWWRRGLPTEIKWSDRPRLDIKEIFGRHWIVGDWSKQEQAWCVAAYRYFQQRGKVK